MSHSGWSASNYISATAGTVPSAVPVTFHARYKPSSTASFAALVSLNAGAGVSHTMRVTSGAKLAALTNTAGGASAVGATSLSTGTWYSCVALYTSSTDRKCYLDGVQDGTDTASKAPASMTNVRVGVQETSSFPALGSLAEVAIWSVALSAEDIAALVYTSPLLIRPDALVCYIPLLDSGTLDLVAPVATVTGTLTKDNDHPRVILPRQRSLIIPKSAGGGAPPATSLPVFSRPPRFMRRRAA